jgi:hypothetical protein
MSRYEVRCEVEIPDTIEVTEEQVEDWAAFYLNATGSLLGTNPLHDLDFDAVAYTVRARKER